MRRLDAALLAAAALILYTLASRHGMAAWPDTVSYNEMAGAIRAGHDPGPNFPPLYPLTLALFRSARVIAGACFAVSTLLVAVAAWRQSGNRRAALLAGSLAITMPPALDIGTSAQSEPLYVALLLGAFVTGSGLLVGLACATRYAGLPMLVLGAFRDRRLGYVVPAALPLAAIIVKNWLFSGAATNRELHVRWPSLALLDEGAGNVTRWILPWISGTPLRYLAAGAVIAVLVRNWRNLFAQAALAHLGFLWMSQALLDAAIIFDDRLLLPFFYLALPVCASAAARQSRGMLALTALAVFSALRCAVWFATDDFSRLHFNAPYHRSSEALRFIRGLPPDVLVLSNGDDFIRFQTGRPALRLPESIGFTTALPRPQWCSELKAMLQGREAWIFWLEFREIRLHLPQPSELPSCVNLDAPLEFKDGQGYKVLSPR